jgi:chemotaxis protein methyltransferase CheR
MKISDFELYRDLLLRNSGLSLTAEKSYLLDSRLTPVSRKWGYPTLEAMTLALRGIPDTALLNDVIEAMSTSDTSFFRDMTPFTTLRDVLIPHLIKDRGRNKHLRIWSAGCGTGQEAYSIAITLKQIESKLKGWKIEIIGTDISSQSIRKASSADYTQFEVQRGLPVSYLIQYFQERDDVWHLQDSIRNLVTFEQSNLIESIDDLGLFDIIFCRNVLSNFENNTRQSILGRMSEQLDENGFLILGESENMAALKTDFTPLSGCPGLYGHNTGRYRIDAAETGTKDVSAAS